MTSYLDPLGGGRPAHAFPSYLEKSGKCRDINFPPERWTIVVDRSIEMARAPISSEQMTMRLPWRRSKETGVIRARHHHIPIMSWIDGVEALMPEQYLAANPDVRAAGLDAVEHFVTYGIAEGRRQFTDPQIIAGMRAEKMSRVRLKPDITLPEPGAPIVALPFDFESSFAVPDHVPVAQNEYNQEIIDIIDSRPDELLLDVGAGLRHTYYSNVVNTEIWPSRSTDVVCVGEDLPFADSQFDYIFCLAVLEHTKKPWIACQEMLRVLKPGGYLHIDWPFLQPFHGYPHHYFNATSIGAASMFHESCDIIASEVKPWQHPVFSLVWILEEWSAGLPEELRSEFGGIKIADLLAGNREIMLQQPFCSRLSPERQDVISAGTTLTCRKR